MSAALFEQDGHSLKDFPLVSGSILYDFEVRENRIYPDLALGRQPCWRRVLASFQ